MKRKILTTVLLSTMAVSSHAAVSLSQTGQGDMVILPYYTVKNNINTTYTVKNHSNTLGKLLLIAYKESKNNQDVLYYNVFLSPNSSWAVGLGAINSTIPQHQGEPSIVEVSGGNQCAPFLSPQQEFLPYAYEGNETSSLSLERAQEGHVEVYEIGSYNPNNQDLNDCSAIMASINTNQSFINQHLSAPTGEISASASLLNVGEGTSYSYNGVAFKGFSDNNSFSFEEHPYYYDFNDASQTANIIHNGVTQSTTWNNGAESINALITSHTLSTDYSIEQGNNSQTEIVLGMPGKIFMTSGSQPLAPFTSTYDSQTGSCETADFSAYSREGQMVSTVNEVDLCWATNVIKVNPTDPSNMSEVLMSQHQTDITPTSITGNINLSFDHTTESVNGTVVNGLPVLGFSVQRYTNANAAPGLLAQYGSLFTLNSTKMMSTQ